MQTSPQPQGALSPFANGSSQDQFESYQSIEANLTDRQRVIILGSRIPIVFGKEDQGEGGVWVTPAAARFGVQIVPGSLTSFSIGLVVSDGQIETIAAKDVYKGAYSILTVPGYRVTFAYSSMPTSGFNYALSNKAIETVAETVGGTMTTKFTIRRTGVRRITLDNFKIMAGGFTLFFTWRITQNGVLASSKTTPVTSLTGTNLSWSTNRDIVIELYAATSTQTTGVTYNPAGAVSGTLTTEIEVAKPIGQDERDLPVFAGEGGTFTGMSCLAVGGSIREYAESGGAPESQAIELDFPHPGGTSDVYTVKNAVSISIDNLRLGTTTSGTLDGVPILALNAYKFELLLNGVVVIPANTTYLSTSVKWTAATPGTFVLRIISNIAGRVKGTGSVSLIKLEDTLPPSSTITTTSTALVVLITTAKIVTTVTGVLSFSMATLNCSTSGGVQYAFRYQLLVNGSVVQDSGGDAFGYTDVFLQLVEPSTIALNIIPSSTFPAGVSCRGTVVTTKTDGTVPPISVVGTGPITWDQQIRCLVRNGVRVSRYVTGGTGSSNNFPDLARYLLQQTDRVDSGTNGQINDTSFELATRFTQKYRLLFNGVVSAPVNAREYLQRIAPFFLLKFGLINGRYSMIPVVGVNSDGSYNLSAAVPNFTLDAGSLVQGSLKWEYINLSERPQSYVAMSWREQDSASYSVVRTMEIKEVSTLIEAPREMYDMSDFATNMDHVTTFGKWLLSYRRHVAYKIEFAASQGLLAAVALGDLVRINFQGTPTFGNAVSESELYRVESVSESDVGILRIKATHCPVTQDGVEAVTNSLVNDTFATYI